MAEMAANPIVRAWCLTGSGARPRLGWRGRPRLRRPASLAAISTAGRPSTGSSSGLGCIPAEQRISGDRRRLWRCCRYFARCRGGHRLHWRRGGRHIHMPLHHGIIHAAGGAGIWAEAQRLAAARAALLHTAADSALLGSRSRTARRTSATLLLWLFLQRAPQRLGTRAQLLPEVACGRGCTLAAAGAARAGGGKRQQPTGGAPTCRDARRNALPARGCQGAGQGCPAPVCAEHVVGLPGTHGEPWCSPAVSGGATGS